MRSLHKYNQELAFLAHAYTEEFVNGIEDAREYPITSSARFLETTLGMVVAGLQIEETSTSRSELYGKKAHLAGKLIEYIDMNHKQESAA